MSLPRDFSVFQAIPAAEQISSGLGFYRGWQEQHKLP